MVNSGDLQDRPPLQMKTIIYNDEAAPWSRNSHLMGTKSLPSSDDSNNIFSRTLQHTCDQDCITMYNSCLLASILLSTYTISCLYPEDGWRWAECLLCLFNVSLPSPCLSIWCLGTGGRPGIWNLRNLGLGSKTLVSVWLTNKNCIYLNVQHDALMCVYNMKWLPYSR
jgi:hypothetical protein